MTRSYRYVGPSEIAGRVTETCGGSIVDTVEELMNSLRWMDDYDSGGSLTVTFVIGLDRRLRLANRRSEHVMCASGHAVLGAGEMTFLCDDKAVLVERVTNQSTGYCPEPESWQSVADALDAIPVDRPDFFDPAIVFRKCPSCYQINVVKDGWYTCEVCQSALPEIWNFD